ncbi:MAG: glycosyltransferase [Hamadaea sp.]|nr:glycosyltransferase [Hamadaea sp.]
MQAPQFVSPPRRPVAALGDLIGDERMRTLVDSAGRLRELLGARTVWQINSTAAGGGVAEMLHVLLGYVLDTGVNVRWLVVDGEDGFFEVTKRLHNRLHGAASGPDLTDRDAQLYARICAEHAAAVADHVRAGDIVVLHDPQTAGMAQALADRGAIVVWRCHVGADERTPVTADAWRFLRPHLAAPRAHVFSRAQYRPEFLADRSWVIPPSIDPYAPKNAALDTATVTAVLRTIGVLAGGPDGTPEYERRDGSTGQVVTSAKILADELPGPGDPVVLQVSRWDRLKDMAGVMRAFADHVAPRRSGYLILTGPQVDDVADDPEGAQVYAECQSAWQALPGAARSRVMLTSLPMDDLDENAVMVNALQRHAAVIAQKSLAEGFGLTVAEAMWKSRPVVGAAVGGILDQLGEGGGTLVDPRDPAAFGRAVRAFLDDPRTAAATGEIAHSRVRREYVGDLHLLRWARLLESLLR